MRIAALVVGAGPAGAAVDGQRRRPDRVVAHPGPWHAALAAVAGDDDWLWLVRGDTEPAPGALGELADVAAGRDGLPEPVLLASKVVGAGGRLDPGSTPWPPLYDRTAAMAAAGHRLAAIRIARWGSLLVRADAIRRHGPPRAGLGAAADLEWTARLLRERPGYVVPGSVAVRAHAPRRSPAELAATARALATGEAWTPAERLWVLYTSLLEGSRPRPSRVPRQSVRRLSGLARFTRR
jgi:hypothetical protein